MNEIHIRKEAHAGRITLNKPKALNALSAAMSIALEIALDEWRNDGEVKLVIIDAVGEKAFCAGGDIVDLYEAGLKGDFKAGQDFWRQEYRLNNKIAEYPKPIITLMQGFVMGGGVGVGCHASHRIVGQSTKIAMPECGIGLLTDVGGTRLLANAPENFGIYLGLTGTRMGALDAILAGFADCYVPEEQWNELKKTLMESGSIDSISSMLKQPEASTLFDDYKSIKECFMFDNVAAIEQALKSETGEFAANALKRLKACSPLSLACTLKAIKSADSMTLVEALEQEYRFTYRAMEHADFLEGIRAQVIDRDFAPKWKHDTLLVHQQDIDQMFAHLDDAELRLN